MAGLTRQRMTHRCTIERDQSAASGAGANPLNAPHAADWRVHLQDVACYYWEPSAQRGEIAGVRNADVYAHRLLVARDLDVTEEDRINGITDRRGATVVDRVFGITQIVRKPDHWLLVLSVVES